MGGMACKPARWAVAIAAQTRLGSSCLRTQRPWCVRKALFQRPVRVWRAGGCSGALVLAWL